MKRQFSACQTPRSMYPSTLKSFQVIRTTNAKKSQFSRTAAHIFVSPGDAPATIAQYVAWMERQFNACQTPRSICPSIFNSFPVIRTASGKKSQFSRTAAHSSPHFCFPWRRRCDCHPVCSMDGKTIQFLPNPSQHVPIYLEYFSSYMMLKSMRKSKNR